MSFDIVAGAGLGQKIMNIKGSSAEDFGEQAARLGNFSAILKPGTMLAVPAGFIVTTWAKADSLALRWTFFQNELINPTCSDMSLRMLAAMFAAYPSLIKQAGYAELKEYLDED